MAVEHEKFKLQQKNSQMAAELAILRGRSSSTRPSLPPSPVLTADLHNNQQAIKQEIEDSLFTLRTPISLPSDSFSPSPSATTNSRSPTPSSLDLGFHVLTTSPDMTQHPAAMLCDLQCQSGREGSAASIPRTTSNRALVPPSTLPIPNRNILVSQLFFLTLTTTIYSQLLLPLLQMSHSLKTGSPLPTSQTTHPMSLRLIRWLILTPADLTGSSTAPTTTASSTVAMTSSRTAKVSRPTFRIRLLRRLLLCSPALARPLLGATVRAMRAERGVALKEKKARSGGVGSEKSWSQMMVLALAIECITKDMGKSRKGRENYRFPGRRRLKCTMALMERGT